MNAKTGSTNRQRYDPEVERTGPDIFQQVIGMPGLNQDWNRRVVSSKLAQHRRKKEVEHRRARANIQPASRRMSKLRDRLTSLEHLLEDGLYIGKEDFACA